MASPEEMAQKMLANLKEKTGKTMPQWLKITRAAKLEKHGQIVKHLKKQGAPQYLDAVTEESDLDDDGGGGGNLAGVDCQWPLWLRWP